MVCYPRGGILPVKSSEKLSMCYYIYVCVYVCMCVFIYSKYKHIVTLTYESLALIITLQGNPVNPTTTTLSPCTDAVSAPNAVYTELPLTISCPVDKGQRVRWAEELTISTRDTLKVIADYDGTSYEEVAKSKVTLPCVCVCVRMCAYVCVRMYVCVCVYNKN